MTKYWAWIVLERAIRDSSELVALAEAIHHGGHGSAAMDRRQPVMAYNAYGDPFAPVDDPDVTPDGPYGVLAVAVGSDTWRDADQFLRDAVTEAVPDTPIRRIVIRRLRPAPPTPIVPPV